MMKTYREKMVDKHEKNKLKKVKKLLTQRTERDKISELRLREKTKRFIFEIEP